MPREMRAVDLFCGAGGATRGLQRAGFKVLGVDTPEAISDEMVEAARLTYARGDYITTDGDNLNALWAECIAASIRAAADQTTREDDNG